MDYQISPIFPPAPRRTPTFVLWAMFAVCVSGAAALAGGLQAADQQARPSARDAIAVLREPPQGVGALDKTGTGRVMPLQVQARQR